MEFTDDQIDFLNKVCGSGIWTSDIDGNIDVFGSVNMSGMDLTEIPVKILWVMGDFDCSNNKLTTLKNCPYYIKTRFIFKNNNLTEYFKSIKEEDFPHWEKLGYSDWEDTLSEYPFLVNIAKKYIKWDYVSIHYFLNRCPQTKIYYKD